LSGLSGFAVERDIFVIAIFVFVFIEELRRCRRSLKEFYEPVLRRLRSAGAVWDFGAVAGRCRDGAGMMLAVPIGLGPEAMSLRHRSDLPPRNHPGAWARPINKTVPLSY